MATRRPLVLVGGSLQELPQADDLPGASVIQSIQTGYAAQNFSVSNGGGEDTHYIDVTISAVNTAKAVVSCYGAGLSYGGSYDLVPATARLINSTTVRVAAWAAWNAVYLKVRWVVTEYK